MGGERHRESKVSCPRTKQTAQSGFHADHYATVLPPGIKGYLNLGAS